ncbi:MAG: zf-HC2 domain-containing protein [Paraburkholderia sp.]|nr:MAG: zf-HC2 domain-containing protein [Paraburkholderia sp.]
MLSCKATSELISKEVDEGLNLKESLDMRLHVMMCSACRNYRGNVNFLRHACKAASSSQSADEPPTQAS